MKVVKRLSIILSIFIMMTCSICVISNATFSPENVKPGDSNVNTAGIVGFSADIAKILTTVGSAASVIVLIILGIKYMIGSPSDKSEYKKSMMPYVIGAVLVFAASTIATLVFNFASTIKT